MDNAVALVRSYLQLNGYFTVTEYPVFEVDEAAGHRTVTDLDMLAFRFAGGGRLAGTTNSTQLSRFDVDAALGSAVGQPDMIVGEVKEGRARINESMVQPAVLRAVLTRFGCCDPESAPKIVTELVRSGIASTPVGHQIRLVVFASVVESTGQPGAHVVSLGHVVRYLQSYLNRHWSILHGGQFKDPAFGFLMTLRKALDGARHGQVHPISDDSA